MDNFTLVIYSQRKDNTQGFLNRIKRLIKSLKGIFIKEKINNWIKEIELYQQLRMFIIKLPYCRDELLKLSKRKLAGLKKRIDAHSNANGVVTCIYPEDLKALFGGSPKIFDGDIIYRANFPIVLDGIIGEMKESINGFEVTVIAGDSKQELFNVLEILSPSVKYVTVLTADKDGIEPEVDSIYDETGLSITLTGDSKNALRNSGLIINLNNGNESTLNSIINPRTVVLNYGAVDSSRIMSECIFIRGINISLPQHILRKLNKDLFSFYDKNFIAEILLFHKTGDCRSTTGGIEDTKLTDRMCREFKNCGFKISSFKGRHGNLDIINSNI